MPQVVGLAAEVQSVVQHSPSTDRSRENVSRVAELVVGVPLVM